MTATLSSAATGDDRGYPSLSYKGTLTMYAAGYTPPIPGVKTAPGTVADPEMQDRRERVRENVPRDQDQLRAGTAHGSEPAQWYISEAAAGSSARCFLGAGLLCKRNLAHRSVPGL